MASCTFTVSQTTSFANDKCPRSCSDPSPHMFTQQMAATTAHDLYSPLMAAMFLGPLGIYIFVCWISRRSADIELVSNLADDVYEEQDVMLVELQQLLKEASDKASSRASAASSQSSAEPFDELECLRKAVHLAAVSAAAVQAAQAGAARVAARAAGAAAASTAAARAEARASAKRAGAEAAKTANAKAAAKAAGIAAAAAAAARAEAEAQAGTEEEAEVGMDSPSLQRFTSDDVKAAVSRVLLPKLMDRE